jgi:hypothetical protein
MVNPKELMLGNWIFSENGFSQTIAAYDFEHTNFDAINPIPLTPEILEKAGFVQQSFFVGKINYWIKGNIVYSSIDNQIELNNPNVFLCKCSHVHQLQNIIYSLTGEELEINL